MSFVFRKRKQATISVSLNGCNFKGNEEISRIVCRKPVPTDNRARWRKAIWYVLQEARRIRTERTKDVPQESRTRSPCTPTVFNVLQKRAGAWTTPSRLLLPSETLETQSSLEDLSPVEPESDDMSATSRSVSPAQSFKDAPTPHETQTAAETTSVLQSSLFIVAQWLCVWFVILVPDLCLLFASDEQTHRIVLLTTIFCWCFFSVELVFRLLFHKQYFLSMYFFLDCFSFLSLVPAVAELAGQERHYLYPLRLFVLFRGWNIARAGSQLSYILDFDMRKILALGMPLEPLGLERIQEERDRDFHRLFVRWCCGITFMFLFLVVLQNFLQVNIDTPAVALQILANNFQLLANSDPGDADFQVLLRSFQNLTRSEGIDLLLLNLGGHVLIDNVRACSTTPCWMPHMLRATCSLPHQDNGSSACELLYESSYPLLKEAMFRTLISVTCMLVLFASSWSFAALFTERFSKPLDKIVGKIEKISANPLHTIVSEEIPQPQIMKIDRWISELTSMLQLGFGEAGSRFISKNLKGRTFSEIITKEPGSIVNAFFGFCNLRNYEDIAEIEGRNAIHIVNRIANSLHTAVTQSHGDPNSNLGHAFLLVWKSKGVRNIQQVADAALRSYVQCILETTRAEFRQDLFERSKTIELDLCFGLHFGWAVECAIGSECKVDLSYLSPHVNIASRLQAASSQYGVSILISGDVFSLLSLPLQELCRKIDRVTLKGSKSPVDLYTFDEPQLESRGGTLKDDIDLSSLSSSADFFEAVQPSTDKDFRAEFSKAIYLYLGGQDGKEANWMAARQHLCNCLRRRPEDGPSKTILSVIDEELFKPLQQRSKWTGYRKLEHK